MDKTKTKKKVAISDDDDGYYDEEDDEEKKDDEKLSIDDSFDSVKSKRGRPKIPEMWSRVISLSHDDLENI
jgi:hypothetical protein